MTIAPNRAVAALTPLVFAPAAGAISVWLAKHAPGVEINSGSLEAIFVAGATIALAKSGLWLKGWQDYEKREQLASHDAAALVAAPIGEPLVDPFDELDAEPDIDEDDLEAAFDDDLDDDDLDDLDLDDDDLEDDEMLAFDEERDGLSHASVQGA